MAEANDLILGEFPRQLDERYRVSIPQEWVQPLTEANGICTLAKERPGCLSLWNTRRSQDELDAGMALVRGKIRAGKLEGRIDEFQLPHVADLGAALELLAPAFPKGEAQPG